MDCHTVDRRRSPTIFRFGQHLRDLFQTLLPRTARGSAKLDLDVMSDFMKRDLGFLDGRDPRQDSDFTR
ncbi:hypothetical protein P6U16_18125 [Rhizobium sp. 32-5/1]|uniref:hypothetical protein n=1 Tax=Rhizobium sp. 32-5/1 TaxID=3019602 RepID=UPI00240E1B46|nr:hypothetical protein [Rhizobium sp. 32-5/1]WEZ82871.1 hypothetical protein P6U16_18125 [Rhizobium sp. 32-5/1]